MESFELGFSYCRFVKSALGGCSPPVNHTPLLHARFGDCPAMEGEIGCCTMTDGTYLWPEVLLPYCLCVKPAYISDGAGICALYRVSFRSTTPTFLGPLQSEA